MSVESPVTVSAEDGVLGAVTMVNEEGTLVAGQLSPDGLTWSTTEPLGYNKRYTLNAQSLGLGGATSQQMTFQTHSPENLTMAYVLPNDGEVVGVGQPVAVQFDENIPNRLAAQKAIKITTNPPVEGAFYWLNNREVRWRPAQYWKPGTTVDVAVNTYGVDLGDGLFGQEDVTTHFTIGDEVIATADDNTKIVTVRRNGEVIKTMPTSMGKNSTPTNNGIYIVGDRFSHIVMDSSTYGVPVNSPNGYRTDVDWATQITYSGIFVHSAPWSVGSQGYTQHQPRLPQRQPEQCRRGSTTTPNEATSSRSSTRWVRSCPAPMGWATGTSRGSNGKRATPTSDVARSLGVADGTRTRDSQDHNLVLYQLNYSHHRRRAVGHVRRRRY